jgi:hypothetical protein
MRQRVASSGGAWKDLRRADVAVSHLRRSADLGIFPSPYGLG